MIPRVKPQSWVTGNQISFAQINQIDHLLSTRALDKSAAGDTLSGKVTVAGGGGGFAFAAGATCDGPINCTNGTGITLNGPVRMGAGQKFLYSPRSIPRVAQTPLVNDTTQVIKIGIISVAPGDIVVQVLHLPDGATLTDVSIGIDPSNPTPPGGVVTLPTLTVVRTNIVTAAVTPLTSAVDPTSGTDYGKLHRFGVSGMSEVIDNTQCAYKAVLAWENGAPALGGLVYPAAFAFTTTHLDEGAA